MSNDQNNQPENEDVQQNGTTQQNAAGSAGADGDVGEQAGDDTGINANSEGGSNAASTEQTKTEGAAEGASSAPEAGKENAAATLSEQDKTDLLGHAIDDALRAATGRTDLSVAELIQQVTAEVTATIAGLGLSEADLADINKGIATAVTNRVQEAQARVQQQLDADAAAAAQGASNAPNVATQGTNDASAPAPATAAPAAADQAQPVHVSVIQSGVDDPALAAAHDQITNELSDSVDAAVSAAPSVSTVVEGMSPVATIVLSEIAKYIDNMDVKRRMDPHTGAIHQVGLFRTLKKALVHLEGDFDLVWQTILNEFVKHGHDDGVFGDRHLFRFYESMTMLQTHEQDQYRALVNLLKNTASVQANGAARKLVLKQTNLQATIKGLEPIAQERLLNFYQV